MAFQVQQSCVISTFSWLLTKRGGRGGAPGPTPKSALDLAGKPRVLLLRTSHFTSQICTADDLLWSTLPVFPPVQGHNNIWSWSVKGHCARFTSAGFQYRSDQWPCEHFSCSECLAGAGYKFTVKYRGPLFKIQLAIPDEESKNGLLEGILSETLSLWCWWQKDWFGWTCTFQSQSLYLGDQCFPPPNGFLLPVLAMFVPRQKS